ncbi:GNAT family N-acetyltransferase [Kribbella rubisoli]|uniref:GNAT family N-acetyltransferase n=1 Tax=Kribbella rubisoli TaxID=3075929 RepID=UPI0018E5167A|nr:GNAT family N-acetyltransferase [Kribbella rubisoli]
MRSTLIEVYADVRADQLHLVHYSVERFREQLARHSSDPGWEVVIGYDDGQPVGFAYANTLTTDDRWWRRMTTPLPDGCTQTPTVAVKEIMLCNPWRGQGIALLIHDELLRDRAEEQVSLLVNALNGDGKVKALYESWGYEPISTQQPSADGPVLTAMLRRTRPPSPSAR